MAHVFISYAHTDRVYARTLADYLLSSGFDVWIDDRINFGTDWEDAIFKSIGGCAAFIVIMTPEAAESAWVKRERFYAEGQRKPPFPLLLEGEVFPFYAPFQYFDVRGGIMPTEDFLDQLAAVAPRAQAAGHDVTNPPPILTSPPRHTLPPTTPTDQRKLEAAMPAETQPGTDTEVWAKISLPDSPGLRGELPAVVASGDVIQKDDTRFTGFPIRFPVDPDTGQPAAAHAQILVTSEEFTVAGGYYEVEIPPDANSRTVVIPLNAKPGAQPGSRARVYLDLIYEGKTIAQISVSTRLVEQVAAPAWSSGGAGDRLGGRNPARRGSASADLRRTPFRRRRAAAAVRNAHRQ